MGQRVFMKAGHAIAEAAIRCGCRLCAAYPVTPATDILEYFSENYPKVSREMPLITDSEVEGIHQMFGAAAAGARCLTASVGLGICHMTEALSAMATSELPCVIVNMSRGDPSTGGGTMGACQGDYFQATKAPGNGDFRLIVLGPATVQEAADLTMEAFELADELRNPVMILGDAGLGQCFEPVEFRQPKPIPPKPWAVGGAKNRKPNHIVINPSWLIPITGAVEEWHGEDEAQALAFEAHIKKMFAKYQSVEPRAESLYLDDCDVVVVAYGTPARIAKGVVKAARQEGRKVGFLRPITLYPFPSQIMAEAASQAKAFVVIELSTGQMLEDVELAVKGKVPVSFYGRLGGMWITPEEIRTEIDKVIKAVR